MRLSTTLLTALLLAGALPARAEAPPEFVKLRDAARPVESLSGFLEKYVGACPDLLERSTCQANSKRVRAEMTGRSFYVMLDDANARLLRPAGFNPGTREFRIELTPFFDGGGIALTEGAPLGQDGDGRPRIPLIRLMAELPFEMMPMDMERLLRTNQVRIHLVFKPQGIWSLPGKKGQKLEGVKAKFQAVRLTNVRTGDEIALRLAK